MDSSKLLKWFDRDTAKYLSVVSGFFSAMLTVGLLYYSLTYRPLTYFEQESFLALQEEVQKNPQDESLREQFRMEDLRRRTEYFESRAKLRLGGYLLLAGLIVFALSIRRLQVLREKMPQPPAGEAAKEQPRRAATLASLVAIPGVAAIAALILFYFVWTAPQQQLLAEQEKAAAQEAEQEEIPENEKWPMFRGPGNNGVAPLGVNPPQTWNIETGENVLWTKTVPMQGNSSPIIWGDRLFVTGADSDFRKVFCFDRFDGALLWTCAIRTPAILKEDADSLGETGLAAPTACTDGKYVFAFFGTNELVAVDFDGKQIWSRWFGEPKSMYGISTSPIYFEGKIYLQLDQGDYEETNSFIYCIDPETGDIDWKTERPVAASWSSPSVMVTDTRKEILTAANPWAISYNPADGKEWWRAEVLSGDVAPVPVHGGGFVFTVTEYSQLAAIRTGGSGNITESHVEWTYDRDLPDVASPITDGELLLLPTGYGTVHCFDVATGEIVWTHEFDEGFWSSPIQVGDKVYMTDREGITFVFGLQREYEEFSQGRVGEDVVTTPAFAGSEIYIRLKNKLICIGEKS